MMKALRYASQLEGYFVEVFEIETGGFQTGKASDRNDDCDLVCASSGGLVVCDSLMAS